MKQQLNIKILYLSFHNSLIKVYGANSIIRRKDVFAKLGRQFLVPQNLREPALKELENMGLLKREDRDNVRVVDSKLNLDNSSMFFQKLHLF